MKDFNKYKLLSEGKAFGDGLKLPYYYLIAAQLMKS